MKILSYAFIAVAILYALFYVYGVYRLWKFTKYDAKARRMWAQGSLISGSIWKHYRNQKDYVIEVVCNGLAKGYKWPLTVVYSPVHGGGAIYSRPAHRFIRNFRCVDMTSNAVPNASQKLSALAAYTLNRTTIPACGSKWFRMFPSDKPEIRLDATSTTYREMDIEFAIVESVTNVKSPTPFVNYRDEHGLLHTETLYNFRDKFKQEPTDANPPVEKFFLQPANLETVLASTVKDGDTLELIKVIGNTLRFGFCGIEIDLFVESNTGFYEGENYQLNGSFLNLKEGYEQLQTA